MSYDDGPFYGEATGESAQSEWGRRGERGQAERGQAERDEPLPRRPAGGPPLYGQPPPYGQGPGYGQGQPPGYGPPQPPMYGQPSTSYGQPPPQGQPPRQESVQYGRAYGRAQVTYGPDQGAPRVRPGAGPGDSQPDDLAVAAAAQDRKAIVIVWSSLAAFASVLLAVLGVTGGLVHAPGKEVDLTEVHFNEPFDVGAATIVIKRALAVPGDDPQDPYGPDVHVDHFIGVVVGFTVTDNQTWDDMGKVVTIEAPEVHEPDRSLATFLRDGHGLKPLQPGLTEDVIIEWGRTSRPVPTSITLVLKCEIRGTFAQSEEHRYSDPRPCGRAVLPITDKTTATSAAPSASAPTAGPTPSVRRT